jgi:murein DD-endopeptidase MepM/ murein hydrolase activator NlpD
MSSAPPHRHGLVDLLLVSVAAWTLWTTTAVGGLLEHARAWAVGEPSHSTELSVFFESPIHRERLAQVIAGLEDTTWRSTAAPTYGFPEPFRTAAGLSLPAVSFERLDAEWTGDPEETLEQLAVSSTDRSRAIRRATAAGVGTPARYEAHRRFLPAAKRVEADKIVRPVMALGKLLDMTWPIRAEHRISSPYGMRTHPVTGVHKLHNGVDLAVPIGTAVHAIQSGTVAAIGEDQANGKYLVINHGHGVRTTYCHLDSRSVLRGEHVTKGHPIALSGNTGRSTGPHLHFTLRVGKRTVDPLPLRPRPAP